MRGVRVQITTDVTQVIPEAGASDRGNVAYPTSGVIRNPSGSQTVYLGGPAVDTTDGWPLAAGEDLEVDMVTDILWGVTAATSTYIYVLRRGE